MRQSWLELPPMNNGSPLFSYCLCSLEKATALSCASMLPNVFRVARGGLLCCIARLERSPRICLLPHFVRWFNESYIHLNWTASTPFYPSTSPTSITNTPPHPLLSCLAPPPTSASLWIEPHFGLFRHLKIWNKSSLGGEKLVLVLQVASGTLCMYLIIKFW